MRFRFRPWHLAVALVLVVLAAVGLVEWRRSRLYDASRLMQTLPVDGAVKVYIDVQQLRKGGLLESLAGPKAAEDPDYRHFAEQIGFDYRTDLDAVAAVFVHGDFYAAVQGHFDWKRLADYAESQHGTCINGLCSLSSDQPDRKISFYLLADNVLALAISDSPQGAGMVEPSNGKKGITVPSAAFWISAPGTDFKGLKNAPTGTQAFLTPLATAREASFSVQAGSVQGGSPAGNKTFEIRMDVACASPDSAAALAKVFSSTTDLLRRLIVGQGSAPKRTDLTAVLVSGRFETHESSVTGFWPMDRRVIESLVSDQMK
ncbi:MAG TPA: hypothetical protein VGG72_19405 [Bryobacteraceae bacterium]|jgi:hypothetical protein